MPTFVENFEPEKGELIYGLRDTRTAYIKAWEDDVRDDDLQRVVDFLTMTSEGGKPNWNIIDNFNDFFFLGGAVNFGASGSKSAVPYELRARLLELEKTVGGAGAGAAADKVDQRAGYATEILQSRFSPASVFDADKAKLSQEGFSKNFKRDDKKIGKKAALQDNRAYLAIRRACKFGIGLAASHGAFAGNSLHFLLDGLDLAEVAQKGQRQGYGGRTSVSITTSELRYVFRNWTALQNVVKFYVNLQEVQAPWAQDWSLATLPGMQPNPIKAERTLWQNYAQQRLAKYGGHIPAKPLI